MKTLAFNRRASFDYHIQDTWEAGIELYGNEVKSLKYGRGSLKGAFVTVYGDDLYLINTHIPHYQNHQDTTFDPERIRKLLMHQREIDSLIGKKSQEGLTIVPIRLYLKRGKVKVEIGLAKGKKKHDKRQDIKEKDEKREMQRTIKKRV